MGKLRKTREKRVAKNAGSVTVEMTLVLPLVVSLCVLVIFLFLDCVYDAKLWGETYNRLYTCRDDFSVEETAAELEQTLSGMIAFGTVEAGEGRTGKELFFAVYAKGKPKGAYHYDREMLTVRREQAVCSDRLRRWQLYGDVIWE